MADSSDPPGGGASGGQGAGAGVPRDVLGAGDEAEARLFPLVMARPDLYQLSVSTIQRLLGRLRDRGPDLSALLAAHQHGAELATVEVADAAAAGIRPELVAAAACALRYRQLVASLAALRRLAALASGRDRRLAWAAIESV